MFSHIMVGASDLERARSFYDALFAATGGKPGRMDEKGRLMYFHRGGLFMVTRPINGEPPTPANGGTIGFAMESEAEADAWHKAGRENGGTAIEEPPGYRQGSFGPLYLDYLRDPDGNKLCALYRKPVA